MIGVRDGAIPAIEPIGEQRLARETVRLADSEVLLPSVVDTHVHVNEPGRARWEGFDSATRAATVGGITTIIDAPVNSVPPTTSVAVCPQACCATGSERFRYLLYKDVNRHASLSRQFV